MPTIDRRVEAAQATLDAFSGRVFDWGEGKADCVRLAAHCLAGLGYKPRLSRGGDYRTERGAAKALQRAGFRDTADWMDDVVGAVNRIAPAYRLPGDIIGFRHPEMGALTGLAVALSNGAVLAFGPDRICHAWANILSVPGADYIAWSCPPVGRS